MSQTLITVLARLVENGIDTAASTFTPTQRRVLEEFARKTGAVQSRKEGRGTVYRVADIQVIKTHLDHLRPMVADQLNTTWPKRAINIAQSRSSKAGRQGHDRFYMLVKAISDGVNWQSSEDEPHRRFNLTEITDTAGVGALTLSQNDTWHTGQPLWLVENQALFDQLDWLPVQSTGSIAYYGGQLPDQWLRWLASRKRASEVILFPDYDGVGLMNYARLKSVCACECRFWLMPDWEYKIHRFGNQQVWLNTIEYFQSATATLRASDAEPELSRLCQTLSSHGQALEQEAVWL